MQYLDDSPTKQSVSLPDHLPPSNQNRPPFSSCVFGQDTIMQVPASGTGQATRLERAVVNQCHPLIFETLSFINEHPVFGANLESFYDQSPCPLALA
jgi:hypothetical protein